MNFSQYAVIDDHVVVDETRALAAVGAGKRVLVIGDSHASPGTLRAATFAYGNIGQSYDGSDEGAMFDAVNNVVCMIDSPAKMVRTDEGTEYPFSDPEQAMVIVRQWHDNELDPIEI